MPGAAGGGCKMRPSDRRAPGCQELAPTRQSAPLDAPPRRRPGAVPPRGRRTWRRGPWSTSPTPRSRIESRHNSKRHELHNLILAPWSSRAIRSDLHTKSQRNVFRENFFLAQFMGNFHGIPHEACGAVACGELGPARGADGGPVCVHDRTRACVRHAGCAVRWSCAVPRQAAGRLRRRVFLGSRGTGRGGRITVG